MERFSSNEEEGLGKLPSDLKHRVKVYCLIPSPFLPLTHYLFGPLWWNWFTSTNCNSHYSHIMNTIRRALGYSGQIRTLCMVCLRLTLCKMFYDLSWGVLAVPILLFCSDPLIVSGLLWFPCPTYLRYTTGPNLEPCLFPVLIFLTTLNLLQTSNHLSLYGYNQKIKSVYMVPLEYTIVIPFDPLPIYP